VHTSRNSRLAEEATHHQSQLLVGSKELWKRTCTAMLKRSLSLRYRPIKPHPFLALAPKVCTARRNSPDQFTPLLPESYGFGIRIRQCRARSRTAASAPLLRPGAVVPHRRGLLSRAVVPHLLLPS
jgi:hypothetical protein